MASVTAWWLGGEWRSRFTRQFMDERERAVSLCCYGILLRIAVPLSLCRCLSVLPSRSRSLHAFLTLPIAACDTTQCHSSTAITAPVSRTLYRRLSLLTMPHCPWLSPSSTLQVHFVSNSGPLLAKIKLAPGECINRIPGMHEATRKCTVSLALRALGGHRPGNPNPSHRPGNPNPSHRPGSSAVCCSYLTHCCLTCCVLQLGLSL